MAIELLPSDPLLSCYRVSSLLAAILQLISMFRILNLLLALDCIPHLVYCLVIEE